MVNPATRTAHGPMLLAAVEDSFPVSQSITRDPLAASLLPLRLRTIAWACAVVITPSSPLACAAAFLTKANARTSSGICATVWPVIGKLSMARALCTPQ